MFVRSKAHMLSAVFLGFYILMSASSICAAPDDNDTWYSTGCSWNHRKAVELNNVQGTTDLTDFPILIEETISELTGCQSDGGDILFTTSGASPTKLDHELVDFNVATGAIEVWVEIPSLDSADGGSSDTYIWMYYEADGACADQWNVAGTWNSGFEAVYHFDSSDQLSDSTSNNRNLTDNASDTGTTGIAGDGVGLDGNDYLSMTEWFLNDPSTMEFWAYMDVPFESMLLCCDEENKNYVGPWTTTKTYYRDDSSSLDQFTPLAVLQQNEWYYHTFRAQSTGNEDRIHRRISEDETDDDTITTSVGTNGFDIETLGDGYSGTTYCWKGFMDEVRFSSVDRSTDWLYNTFKTIKDPQGYSAIGAEKSPPEICNVAGDEDNDTYYDCQDPDCYTTHETGPDGGPCYQNENTDALCQDTYDNDYGQTPDGADCLDSQCDGKDGWATGEHCESIEGEDEPTLNSCGDGKDNDADGTIDCLDSSCDTKSDCEYGTELTCNDNIDNDADGYTDCGDPDCDGDTGCLGISESFEGTGYEETWTGSTVTNGNIDPDAQDFPGVAPTGLGEHFFKSTVTASNGKAFRYLDTGDNGPQQALTVFFSVDVEGLDDGHEANIWVLTDGSTDGYRGRIRQNAGQLQYITQGNYNSIWVPNTSADWTDIELDKWYYVNFWSDPDEFEADFYHATGSLHDLIDAIDLTSLTNPPSPDTLEVGVQAGALGASPTTTVYFDIVDWDNTKDNENRPGIIKQTTYGEGRVTAGFQVDDNTMFIESFNAPSTLHNGFDTYMNVTDATNTFVWDWASRTESGTGSLNPNYTTAVHPDGGAEAFRAYKSGAADTNNAYVYMSLDRGPDDYSGELVISLKVRLKAVTTDSGFDDSTILVLRDVTDFRDMLLVKATYDDGVEGGFSVWYYDYNAASWHQDFATLANVSVTDWTTINVHWKQATGTGIGNNDGGLSVKFNSGAATTDTTIYNGGKNTHLPERLYIGVSKDGVSGGTGDWEIILDPLVLKDCEGASCTLGSSFVDYAGIDSVLSDGDDSTFVQCSESADATDDTWTSANFNSMSNSIVQAFDNPTHIGSILGMRMYYKGKQYDATNMNAVVSTWYDTGNGNYQQRYPWIPRTFGSNWRWAYLEWTEDPKIYLPYTSKIGSFSIGDQVVADINDGGASGNLFGVVADSPTGHTSELEITYRTQMRNGAGCEDVKNGLGFVIGETIGKCQTSDPDNDCDSATCEGRDAFNYATVSGQYYQDSISWTSADDFTGEVRVTESHPQAEIDPGVKISEMKMVTLSTNDSQVYVETIIGTGAYTDKLNFKGVLSGAGDVKIRFGTSENAVKYNASGAYTTNTGYSATPGNGYSYHIDVVDEDADIVDHNGNAVNPFDFASKGIYGSTIYFDVLVKGSGASSYISTFRLEAGSNEAWEQVIPGGTLQTIAFPASSYTGDVVIGCVSDRHSQNRWDLWENFATRLASEGAKFITDMGDEWKDGGDVLRSIRERAKWTQGFAGGPDRMYVLAKYPYVKMWSDHDYLLDNATKAGAGTYGQEDDTVVESGTNNHQYFRTYNAVKGNLERMPYDDDNLSNDYAGSVLTNIDWSTADAGSTATTLNHTGRDFTTGDGSGASDYKVWPGDVVHYRDTVNNNYGYGLVQSVSYSGGVGTLTTTAIKDAYGNTTYQWDDVNAQYFVQRKGVWQKVEYGQVLLLLALDSRSHSDRPGYPGCDWLDGRADGSAAKVMGTATTCLDAKCSDGTNDGFEIELAGNPDLSDLDPGDVVIWQVASVDTYAHIKYDEDRNNVIDDTNDIVTLDVSTNLPTSGTVNFYEASSSDHGSIAANDAAGHKQRTMFEYEILNATQLSKLVACDIQFLHNEMGAAFDAACDRDGVVYVDYDNIANYGIRKLKIKCDNNVDNFCGGGSCSGGYWVEGSVSGARGKLDSIDTTDNVMTFVIDYTEGAGGCFYGGEPKTWNCTPNGEFIMDDTITEYSDENMSTATGYSCSPQAPPSTAEFTSTDSSIYPSYNRFWRASSLREYIHRILLQTINVGYIVGDRHFDAIDSATHSDDHFYQLNSGPQMYGSTMMKGSWFISGDAYGKAPGEYSSLHLDNVNAGYFVGAYGIIKVDYANSEGTMTLYNGADNTIISSTHGSGTDLTVTYNLTTTLIDEDFEAPGMEETWTDVVTWLYADDYFIDDAVGM